MPSLPYPIFHWSPDFTDPPRYSTTTAQAILEASRATRIVGFPQERVDRLFRFRFMLGQSNAYPLLEFFRDRAGSVRPFFLPSWRRDLNPQAGVATGQTSIAVDYVDYNSLHLGSQPQDHYGRYLFAWTPGQPVFVERVIQATAIGLVTDTLDLDSPFPWAANADQLLLGFAHLSHFDADDLSLECMSAEHASTELVFRSSRYAVTP